jgi:DNA-binding HxlR family transcriptional regulator
MTIGCDSCFHRRYEYHSYSRRASLSDIVNIMPRKYDLNCPVARTLDIIGDRWTILILRDLFRFETRRFQDFDATLPGLTPSVLSARLKALESDGVVASRFYEEHPPRLEYFLTPKARELGPILLAMKKWGDKHT